MDKSQKFPKNTSSYDESNGVKFFFQIFVHLLCGHVKLNPKKCRPIKPIAPAYNSRGCLPLPRLLLLYLYV